MLERREWNTQRFGSDPNHAEREIISFNDIQRFLTTYWLTLTACIVAAIFVAIVYLAVATPQFTAKAQVLIETGIPHTLKEQASENMSLSTPQVESQLALIKSERVARKAAKRLGLLDKPAGPEPELSELAALVSQIRGYVLRLKKALLSWIPGTYIEIPGANDKMRLAIAKIASGLYAKREGLSFVINISYQSTDPQAAAEFANAIAEAYVEDQLDTRAIAAEKGGKWLQERIGELRKSMNATALDAQRFKAKRDYRLPGRNSKRASTFAEKVHGARKTQPGNDETTLEELESRAETYRKIYESYLQTYAETVQKQSYPVTNARVITSASPPSRKSHPPTLLTAALAVAVGGLMGLGIALIRNSLDRKLRSPRQVRDELGLECLGQVAQHDKMGARRGLMYLKSKFLGLDKQTVNIAYHLTEVRDLPLSRFSESVRSVRTAINLAIKKQPCRTIGITSTIPGEGKTTFVGNLATLYSIQNTRVLIIDADIRNPSLSRCLAPDSKIGLIEAMSGTAEIAECIVKRDAKIPDVLPATETTKTFESEELLGSEAMQLLMEKLQEDYDLIFLDLAPLDPVFSGLGLCSLLDSVILVSEWGCTPVRLLTETIRELSKADASILGIVLTKAENGVGESYGKRIRAGASGYLLRQ